jgi:predicted Zn-dependent peptidase
VPDHEHAVDEDPDHDRRQPGEDVQDDLQGERDPRPRYVNSIDFGSAPDRTDALSKALFAQLDSLKRNGPAPATLAKVKEAAIRSRETNLRQNGYWLAQIVSFDRLGWPLAEIPAGDKLIASLDARSIQDAARRYLDAGAAALGVGSAATRPGGIAALTHAGAPF